MLYLDSGATNHLIGDKNLFTELKYNDSQAKIILADGKTLYSQGKGYVDLDLEDERGLQKIRLTDVYYVPGLKSNLISVKQIASKGYSVTFDKENCFVKKENQLIMRAHSDYDSLYRIVLNKHSMREIKELN